MQTTEQEMAHDEFVPTNKSMIRLEDSNRSKYLGISGFYIKKLFADFILCEYIDMTGGIREDKETGFKIVETNEARSWRKAIVRMVSPYVERCNTFNVGDIIIFPNDFGLETGVASYIDADGNVKKTQNCVFLNAERVFATLGSIDS